MNTAFVAAYVLPSIAGTSSGYVNDVLAAATNRSAIGNIGLLNTALHVQGITYLAGGLLFGIALYRAAVLARWAAALLAVGGIVTAVLSVMPDAFYRLLALPNGIAMIALGFSLWREQRPQGVVPVTSRAGRHQILRDRRSAQCAPRSSPGQDFIRPET